jgi:dihydrofolate synthase/folylpolyglutamate synthase
VAEETIREGLRSVRWPGRLQQIPLGDGRSILLDGAHNPAGAETLRDALRRHFRGQRFTLILGILRDKDWKNICRILAPEAARVLLAPVSSDRAAQPADLEPVCRAVKPGLEVTTCFSLAEALACARSEPFVVLTGSLHFVGEAMELLHLEPAALDERGLNEWDASAARRGPIPAAVHAGTGVE